MEGQMAKGNQQNLILSAMGAWAVMIAVAGSIFHIGIVIVVAAVSSLLLVMVFIWRRSRATQPISKTFWAVLEASLIFFAGALYGFWESLREGWRWTDLLYLIFPLAMGSYLLWFALRIRRKASV